MTQLYHVIGIVLPIFLLMGCGYGARRRGILSAEAVTGISKFVFYFGLPSLIFSESLGLDWRGFLDGPILKIVYTVTILFFACVWFVLAFLRWPAAQKGVFAQGAYRANMAFVGLAICFNAFGSAGLRQGALVLALTIPLYNVLAVLSLVLPHHQRWTGETVRKLVRAILQNPLTLAALASALYALLDRPLPHVLRTTLQLLSQTALPLALVAVGAGFDRVAFGRGVGKSLAASCLKLIVYPACAFWALRRVGVPPTATAITVMLMASPTAVSSYVMAREMDGDAPLASGIVMVSTALSAMTLVGWLYVLGVGR